MTVNKKQLINEMAERTGLYKYEVKNFFETLEDVMKEHLISGDEIKIHSLFKAELKEYKGFIGNDLRTSKEIEIPTRRKVKVTISRIVNKEIESLME